MPVGKTMVDSRKVYKNKCEKANGCPYLLPTRLLGKENVLFYLTFLSCQSQ